MLAVRLLSVQVRIGLSIAYLVSPLNYSESKKEQRNLLVYLHEFG
jgi:hypothetical protein